MAAPKGNQFWKLRSKHGRDKLFANAALLWDAACDYFEWCDNHPWRSEKVKNKPSGKETENAPTQRPYSITGLCIYLGCNQGYFSDFKKNCNKDFSEIITCIEEIIETQQFEGVTVGAFTSNLIARKMGYVDKQDIIINIEKPLTKAQLEERLKQIEGEI